MAININWISNGIIFIQWISIILIFIIKGWLMNKYIFEIIWIFIKDILYVCSKISIYYLFFYSQKSWISNHEIIDFSKIDQQVLYMKLENYEKTEITKFRFILWRINFFIVHFLIFNMNIFSNMSWANALLPLIYVPFW